MRTAWLALVAALLAGTARADAPIVIHDCGSVHPRPRPCDNAADVTRDTSVYFEVVVTFADHYPNDGVDLDSIVVNLRKGAEPPRRLYGPNQVFGAGVGGKVIPQFRDGDLWGYGFYLVTAAPLAPLTTYTVKVLGQTRSTDTPIDPTTASWTFTTRRDLTGAALPMPVDLAAPTVHWNGRWFAGECKPNFDTSRMFDQEGVYGLMDEAAARAPLFLAEQRDYPWMADYWQASIFDGNLNIVRERETRRITKYQDLADRTELTLADLVEAPLYAIPPDRPLSTDYHPGDLVLVCDATKSEVRRVLSVDDATKKVRVEKLVTPAAQWTPGDPNVPADNPATPDNFTYPLGALRKYSPAGTPVYYWARLDDELDQHVAHGRRPQFNPFSTPLDLCLTGVAENANGGVCGDEPKDWVEWDEVIRTILGHLLDRYGEQVLDWTYSIGNEPDLFGIWGDSNRFFRYYDYTSNAILRAFEERGLDASRIRIGGVEIGIFDAKIKDMLYHCSPSAQNPNTSFVETNAVCLDPAFDGRRAARVEQFCAGAALGCPLDYISIHTYSAAAQAATRILRARDWSLQIDPSFYDDLDVHSHETTPDWMGARDPGWKEVFRWGGYFPTWGADYFRRLLDAAAADPRKAGGQATITAWPFNYNFVGDASIAGFMRVDEDGDGTQDRVEAVADSFFRFAELAAWMSHDLAPLPHVDDAGATLAGWRAVEPARDHLLLYAHDPYDVEGRETRGWDVALQLSGLRFAGVAVTEYRVDRDHGARAALAALPDRGSNGVFRPDEIAPLVAASRLVPLGPPTCRAATGGALELGTRVLAQGVTYLELTKAQLPAEVPDLAFAGDKETLAWTSASGAGPGTVHDVLRGDLASLPVGSGPETCLAHGIDAASAADPALPAPGAGFWYLVRGRNACATGSYGATSAGAERVSPACS
ncbi:MAG: hypothetical protein KBD01_15905 [Acidobacteria bacterium]|nr:hypothetical protein [Acidobacteriota bacterium]